LPLQVKKSSFSTSFRNLVSTLLCRSHKERWPSFLFFPKMLLFPPFPPVSLLFLKTLYAPPFDFFFSLPPVPTWIRIWSLLPSLTPFPKKALPRLKEKIVFSGPLLFPPDVFPWYKGRVSPSLPWSQQSEDVTPLFPPGSSFFSSSSSCILSRVPPLFKGFFGHGRPLFPARKTLLFRSSSPPPRCRNAGN